MIKKVRYLDTTLVAAAACLQLQLFRREIKRLVGFAGWSAWIMSSIRRRYAWRILQLLAVHRRSRSWYERCHRFRTFSPEFLFVCFKIGGSLYLLLYVFMPKAFFHNHLPPRGQPLLLSLRVSPKV